MYSVHTDRDWGIFLHVFVVVINCICQVVTCVVQLCVVFILILIGGQRDKGVSPPHILYPWVACNAINTLLFKNYNDQRAQITGSAPLASLKVMQSTTTQY